MKHITLLLPVLLVACGQSGAPETLPAQPLTQIMPNTLPASSAPVEPVHVAVHVPDETQYVQQLIQQIEQVPAPLTLPDVYAVSLITEQWRDQVGLPHPWTVATMTLTWEPLPGHEYTLSYDNQIVPGAITSPWVITSEYPVALDQFHYGVLPVIKLQSCDGVNLECEISDVIEWVF